MFLACQDTVPPVRNGFREPPTYVDHPRVVRPAGEHEGGDSHPAGLLDRYRASPADVAHDLRVVGERGRRHGIGEHVLLFFLHSVEDGSCDGLRRSLRYVGVSDFAKTLQRPRGAGMAEHPGAIARNRRLTRAQAARAPRSRRYGRGAPLVARLGPRKTLRARGRVPLGPRRAFGLPRGGPGRREWLQRASAPPRA